MTAKERKFFGSFFQEKSIFLLLAMSAASPH
jgi:hypothetical protein